MKMINTSSELYQLLQDVTHHIISWAKPGMRMCDLDREARRMLGEYEKYFTHSLGHGVGLEIHESPRVSSKSREILRPGMVITIEPGIYGLQNNKEKIIKNKEGTCKNLAAHPLPTQDEGEKNQNSPFLEDFDRELSRTGAEQGEQRGGCFECENVEESNIYGLRYEEMVLVDKDRLVVL